MLNIFTGGGDRGRAVLMASGLRPGTKIIVWGFAPFWIGQTRQQIENIQATVGGGFNIEARDGLYINTKPLAADASPSMVPVVLDWSGDVWILNGNGAGDSAINAVSVQVFAPC